MSRALQIAAFALLLPVAVAAQTPDSTKKHPPTPQAAQGHRPANATGACNDGTWWTGTNPQGACGGHGGIKEWYGVTRPANAAARCNDGSYWTSPVREGACSTHRGVKEWYQAARPANATARCNDNTYWTGATRQGACAGHGGIKDWYAQ
jgi:hypothetical protein